MPLFSRAPSPKLSFIGLAIIDNLYRKKSDLSIKINNYLNPLTSLKGNFSATSSISELDWIQSSLSSIVQKSDKIDAI